MYFTQDEIKTKQNKAYQNRSYSTFSEKFLLYCQKKIQHWLGPIPQVSQILRSWGWSVAHWDLPWAAEWIEDKSWKLSKCVNKKERGKEGWKGGKESWNWEVNTWKIAWNEGTKSQKDKCCRFSFIWGSYLQIFRCEYLPWMNCRSKES